MRDKISKIGVWIKNNKLKTLLILIFVICLTTGISYAYFMATGSGTIKDIAMGNLSIVYTDGETINSTNSLPLLEDEVDEYASKTSFSIKNTGNLTAYSEISLVINSLPSALDSEDFRWTLYKEEDAISTGSFKNAGDKLVLKKEEVIYPSETATNYSIAIWIRENGGNQNNMLRQTLNAKINIQATDKHGEYAESGINPPELVEGLIPVVYDDTNDVWVKANVRKKWYSYADQEWANAVTVTSTNRSKYESAKDGTEIPMTHINSMWVWIPRFKYKIASGLGSSSNLTNPPQIDVVFEAGLKSTGVSESVYRAGIGSDGTNTNYYTHPAFRNGAKVYNVTPYDIGGWDKELTGFWVAKFEAGTTNQTCNTSASEANCLDVDPIIKPNVQSLRYQTVITQFKTALKFAGGTFNSSTGEVTFTTNANNIYGLNTTSNTTDTHMMKNTEWGAVAILSQSQYGKMGNANYTGTNKEVYKNDSYSSSTGSYTGRSSGVPLTTGNSPYGTYSYNDMICSDSTCTGEKVAYSGTGASTTGTIYGVYDMSGGKGEYTMGNWASTKGSSGFTTYPTSKYYDLYQGTSSPSITKEKAILGDATWETMSWYSDSANFVFTNYPWAFRGGNYNSASTAGVFNSNVDSGSANDGSFRPLLIP